MRKILFFFIAVLAMVSCASTMRVTCAQSISDTRMLIEQSRPEMLEYYDAGVLQINSITPIESYGEVLSYDIRYKFIRYHLSYEEAIEYLRLYQPELYSLYRAGRVAISDVYRYVDDYGVIRHHVTYHRIGYGYSYYPYYGHRYYSHRPFAVTRPAPRPPVHHHHATPPKPPHHVNPPKPPHNATPNHSGGGQHHEARPNNGGTHRPATPPSAGNSHRRVAPSNSGSRQSAGSAPRSGGTSSHRPSGGSSRRR